LVWGDVCFGQKTLYKKKTKGEKKTKRWIFTSKRLGTGRKKHGGTFNHGGTGGVNNKRVTNKCKLLGQGGGGESGCGRLKGSQRKKSVPHGEGGATRKLFVRQKDRDVLKRRGRYGTSGRRTVQEKAVKKSSGGKKNKSWSEEGGKRSGKKNKLPTSSQTGQP